MIKILLKFSVLIFLFSVILSCNKNCVTTISFCNDVPPDDEACAAFFNRWFYDSENNNCALIGYSGCSQYGFATEEECRACECD